MTKQRQAQEDRKIQRETLRLFWESNFQQKWSLFLTYIVRIPAFAIQGVVVPLYVAFGLEAIVTRNFDAVPGYALTVLVLTLIYGVLVGIGAWAIGHNGTTAYNYVLRKVFRNFLHKDYEFYTNAYFGSLGAQAIQLRDAGSAYGKIVTQDIPKQVTTVVAGLVVIAYSAPLLAVITLLCMFFVLSYTAWSSRWRLIYLRKLGESNSLLSGILGDALTHNATVKSFAAENYEIERLEPALKNWKRAQFNSWMATIPGDAGRNILSAITICSLLLFTTTLYRDGSISIAIVTLVQLYVIRMITITQEITETIKAYEGVIGSSHQAIKTMLLAPTIIDKHGATELPADSPKKSVFFRKVGFNYPGAIKNNKAVSSFNLEIKKGEKVGLVGYSGSGKTTLTKLLLRFLDVDSGSIEIDGVDIRSVTQKSLRGVLSYVPQEPLLFHRSIGDNIGYGNPAAQRKELERAAQLANVDEFVNTLPAKYKTLVGERGVRLSGGQRQRVAIARAVLKDSPVLILDEATSALDSRSEKLIQEALWNLMKNRTALVIAHRLSTIQKMDRIAVMDKGSIVQLGTHAELLKQKDGIYAQLWKHQSGGYIVDPAKLED